MLKFVFPNSGNIYRKRVSVALLTEGEGWGGAITKTAISDFSLRSSSSSLYIYIFFLSWEVEWFNASHMIIVEYLGQGLLH